MMSYNARSPNMLSYITNLNRIPSDSDTQLSVIDQFNLENNLAMFSNTQFFEFDLGHDADLQKTGFQASTDPKISLHDFSYNRFGTFPENFENQDEQDSVDAPTSTTVDPYNPSTLVGCSDSHNNQNKNLMNSPSSSSEINEISRHAAEEDKRRRNTAASARFRIKKKQREQALERSAKEMSDKVGKLENRIKVLEMENKWLKDLITDKNDNQMRDAHVDSTSSWKHIKQEKSPKQRSDGVGTEITG